MAIISYNVGKSITFWQEADNIGHLGEAAIVIGKDATGTYYFEQEGRSVFISGYEMKNFIKAVKEFMKDNE